jgi:1-acyl-sn-glycerol-3-phosphate acyltransferase
LAREVGGTRAETSVTPTASLERDVGLGSLERVELLMRLETALARELGDRFLVLDTPREMAQALEETPIMTRAMVSEVTAPQGASTLQLESVPTLVAALRRRAEAEPARIHAYLQDDPDAPPVTYGALWDGAMRIASALTARGVRRGDRVALMLPTGFDFLQSFMGILAAGAAAVPLYPPARLDRMAEYLKRQSRILANAEVAVLIGLPEAAPVSQMLRGAAPTLDTITTTRALLREASEWKSEDGASDDLALIQYTSGSTGDPKGVPLTHANLLANIHAIATALELRPTDVAASWLPMYHDMGLIGTWLCTLVQGIPLALMSPLSFLARPERWLWAIHQRRATLSAAPNFAYELCARKVKEEALVGLDLSSWRCALDGSEPVSAASLERFVLRFERYGLRHHAMTPVYGLAESAVALCFPPLDRGPLVDRVTRESFACDGIAAPALAQDASALEFVSVGRPIAGHEVRLVDENDAELPDRVVGHLHFRGPSCTAGYFRNPGATASIMHPTGWLDSGDLAYRSAGELFITGRVKDLIIKSGRNLVPQEIEELAGSVEGVRKGCVAAFGLLDEELGTERLIVVAESRLAEPAERERLARDIIARVSEGVGVPPDVVQVVPPGTVPKTPSGKVRRAAARAAYQGGHLGERNAAPLRLRAGLMVGAANEALRDAGNRVARGLYAVYCVIAWLFSVVFFVPPLWMLVHLLPAGRPARMLGRIASRVALTITGCWLRVEGRERIPREGAMILVANHASFADTPALMVGLPMDFRIVAMVEVLKWPFVGDFVRRGEHPTVDRWHPSRGVSDAAAIEARLRAGDAVLFFPEGGFARTRGLRAFRLGAFEAAVSTGTPVIPVAIRGTRRVLRGGTRLPHPGHVDIWIGEPLRAEGAGWDAALRLRDRAAEAIAAHCGEPRLG